MEIKRFLSAVAILFALAACDNVPEPVPTLTLKSKVVEFDSSESSSEIAVESSVAWSAVVDSAATDWLSAETKDGSLLLSVTANSSLQDREGSVFLAAGPKKAVVSVVQAGVSLSAKVSRDTVSFLVSGGNVSFDVESSADWRLDTSEDWLSADMGRGAPGKSTVTLTVLPNDNFAARTGYAKICFGMKTLASVVVVQDPFVVSTSLSKKSLEAPIEGGGTQVEYTSNYPWTATSDKWITLSPDSGEASDAAQSLSVTFEEASALERSGKIIFVAGNVRDTVIVHQDKALAKPIVMEINLFDSSTGKHSSKLAIKESIVSSVAQSYDKGVVKLTLVNYPDYSLEYYSSYIGPLMNGASGLITAPAIVSGKTTNAIRPTEGFAYIKFPAISGFKLDKVEIVSPNVASSNTNFPTYITPTYGSSNAEAKAAAVTPVINLLRNSTAVYNLSGSVDNTSYYLFMEPNGGTSTTTNGYLISSITLTYNPVK